MDPLNQRMGISEEQIEDFWHFDLHWSYFKARTGGGRVTTFFHAFKSRFRIWTSGVTAVQPVG